MRKSSHIPITSSATIYCQDLHEVEIFVVTCLDVELTRFSCTLTLITPPSKEMFAR